MSQSVLGRCIWYRSMRSVPRRRSESSTARTIQRRDPPCVLGSVPICWWNVAASTTSSRRPANALPTIVSDSPWN